MRHTASATPGVTGTAGRALILDDHSYTAVQVCRQLAKRGYVVETFAERSAPVFTSQFCHRKHYSDSHNSDSDDTGWTRLLENLAADGSFDVIYLCSEHLLDPITQHIQHSAPWRGLLLSEPSLLPTLLSKNSVMQLVGEAGIPIPKTLFPATEREMDALGSTLGFPLLVKGEGGESSRTIRIIRDRSELLANYRAIMDQEKRHDSKPSLQEFITGPTYSVGGLFQDGRPIRICAGRMALMEPYKAGLMVKGVTERPPKLIANALRVFEVLRYTGFGDADFVLDPRDGQFKFLEVNPEVWANIVLAEHAGVDFHGPYRALAQGDFVPADLTFREGVSFYRVTKRLLSTLKRPWLGMTFLRDFLDDSVHSDWNWTDLRPDIHLLINSVRRRGRALFREVTGKTLRSHP
jgi:predicted ATP-grasp superfamily ATP-dependent carboligase